MLTKISSSLAPEQVINAITTLFHQGKITDILARAPKILLEEYPDTPSLYNILGVIHFHQGFKQEAIILGKQLNCYQMILMPIII